MAKPRSKNFSGRKLAHGKKQDTKATFNVDAVKGLFDRNKTRYEMYDDYFETGKISPDMWTKETVIRDENDPPIYDEVVAGLSVPRSSLYMYNKNKRGDFALKQTQKNLIQAEKFSLSNNFVKMAVSLSFSYPQYISQLLPKAIPCFDNLWIEWNELARFDALQEEFQKLGLPADVNRKSVSNRIGYHVERSSKGFTYNFFTCDAHYNEDGTKAPKKIMASTFEWTLLNDESSLTNIEEPFWFFGLGTAYSKFHRNDDGINRLNNFSKNFTFKPSMLSPALWEEFADGNVEAKNPQMYTRLKEMAGHGIDGDVRFLVAVFALLNYPRYVSAVLPAPKKVSTIRWGRRVPRNEIKVVEIDLPKKGVNVYGQLFTGHGSPKRQHARRGHPRRYRDKTGKVIKKIWIEPKVVGNPELGIINHEYVLQVQKDRRRKGLQN